VRRTGTIPSVWPLTIVEAEAGIAMVIVKGGVDGELTVIEELDFLPSH
jgi:hypothetical protein